MSYDQRKLDKCEHKCEHKCDQNSSHQILEHDDFVLLDADGLVGLEVLCGDQASSSCQTAAPTPST